MLLGGLWHGASWTFVFWGALHGLYLMANHGWRAASARDFWLVRQPAEAAAWIAAGLAIVWLLPNTVEWVGHRGRGAQAAARSRIPAWRPTAGFALATGAAFAYSLACLGKPSPFLYFQF